MAVIIYGSREYGRVDDHRGEHASTRFFHVWFAPLFPIGSSWFTSPTSAIPIKLSGKSIAATYLRVWGPIAVLGCVSGAFEGSAVHGMRIWPLLLAAAFAALSVWSWTWRSLRGAAAKRRSDFNYVAFGTRCDPSRMQHAQLVAAKRELDRRWTERAPEHTPNEVATHGAKDPMEAVLAYGLLRLAAIDHPRSGGQDAADAERILAGKFDAPETEDGPYRAGPAQVGDGASDAALADLVEARAAATAPHAPYVDKYGELRKKRRRSRLQAAGLAFLTLSAFGCILGAFAAMQPAIDVTIKDLRAIKPPIHRTVTVTCDSVQPAMWEEVDEHGSATAQIAMCQLGRYLVPLKLPAHTTPPRTVTGKLYEVSDKLLWVYQGLARAPDIMARSTDVYIDTTSNGDGFMIAIGLTFAVVTPLLWVLWFRARRRRRAAERALVTSS